MSNTVLVGLYQENKMLSQKVDELEKRLERHSEHISQLKYANYRLESQVSDNEIVLQTLIKMLDLTEEQRLELCY